MQSLSLNQIAVIVDGEIFSPQHLCNSSVSTLISDSRTFFYTPNSAFIALHGPTNNGHNYIETLLAKGIEVFIVSSKDVINTKAAFILVEDTQIALQKMAAYNRKQLTYPVIGITGSNGKTIIKEWLHDILSEQFKIVRSPKSYNSQVGVPFSVLLMKEHFDLGIFEAGISQPDEMVHLSEIILPDFGILSNIGDAHQENFTSLAQKLEEKLLLFRKCKNLVFCSDKTLIKEKVGAFCTKYKIKTTSWSLKDNPAEIKFAAAKLSFATKITASVNGNTYAFTIPFVDDSAIENACHCFGTLIAMQLNPSHFLEKFEKLQTIAMRLEIKKGINNCLLINDYYNSDLNALGIALSVLKQQAAKQHPTKLVILSDIQQSGITNYELYKKVNELFEQWKIDKIIGIGTDIFNHQNCFTTAGDFYISRTDFEHHLHRADFRESAILIKGARQFEFEKISALLQQKAHQTVLEINLNALIHNLTVFRKLLKPKTKIMVMVKAFSYGSGDVEIARLLQHQNIDYLAVAVADEGVQLRKAGITIPILVMNPEQESFQNMLDYRLEPNIYSLSLLKQFAKSVSENGQHNYPIHLKIDTGMNRLGLKDESEINQTLVFFESEDILKIKSVFSHLAASDEPDMDDFTHLQIEKFESCFNQVTSKFPHKIERHILNSAGIERFTNKQFDMVRLGIGLYGVSQTQLPLECIGTLKSTISQIKTINTDETVGYGRKGKVKQKSTIAIVPMGYADGLDRKLGNGNGKAFVNGSFTPIIGNICMDMLMLDVSKIEVNVGDSVEFFGANISIEQMADAVGTIPYEVLTGISQRVKRIYVQE